MDKGAVIGNLGRKMVAAELGEDDPGRRRNRRLAIWFYVGVPLALGFLLGWLQVGRAADWPRSISLLYWTSVSLVTTPLNALGTALIAPLLRQLRSPLALTLLCGQVVGGFLFVNPALHVYRRWLHENVYSGLVLTAATTLTEFLQRLPTNALLWVGMNLAFFYGLRMPRFGYSPPPPTPATVPAPAGRDEATPAAVRSTAAAPQVGPPPLMGRVRPDRRGVLLALEAEGHYLRVHTSVGSDLIFYRLSDAMNEVSAADGMRVHRSWWVAAQALSEERHRGHLRLVNGVEVPVSRSFRVAARERGWLAGTDSRDG